MCLSTVYKTTENGREEVCKNIASMTMEDGKLILTDLMGRRTELEGKLEKVDLMDNYILVKTT